MPRRCYSRSNESIASRVASLGCAERATVGILITWDPGETLQVTKEEFVSALRSLNAPLPGTALKQYMRDLVQGESSRLPRVRRWRPPSIRSYDASRSNHQSSSAAPPLPPTTRPLHTKATTYSHLITIPASSLIDAFILAAIESFAPKQRQNHALIHQVKLKSSSTLRAR